MKALRRSNTSSPSSSSSSWIQLRSLLVVASTPAPDRGSIKSPWSQRKRKNALSSRQWNSLFLPDGKLRDGGVKFLRKARRGGIDPSIRASVWPFLLGVYDLNSTEADRSNIQTQRRAEYEKLRRRCRRLNHHDRINRLKGVGEASKKGITTLSDDPESLFSEDFSATSFSVEGSAKEDRPVLDKAPDRDRNACEIEAFSVEGSAKEDRPVLDKAPDRDLNACEIEEASDTEDRAIYDRTPNYNPCNVDGSCHGDQAAYHKSSSDSGTTQADASAVETESSCSESSGEEDDEGVHISSEGILGPEPEYASVKGDFSSRTAEDFATWWRIIRLDALRINAEWVIYSPNQATISKDKADQCAEAVGMKDYDHLEPCMVFHAARLVALLEAYALYDPEIGYCQGMSDLLSPILAVIEDDHEAFWCFVGFMRKARHNFRLDEVGIRRQLGIVAKIIKSKDLLLYKHLENLQAEDCFFLYRMVVVLFRRELSFEQTVCLWEVMWADQTAIRAGNSKSSWGRIRLRAPPTDDLLLYAIAACVLQRRKLIIQKYSSMDEIIRECNDMAGQLDVWRLLDDAHDLVVTLHDRI